MTGDLGHPLQVGVLLPADPADPGAPLRAARHAEQAGLDLAVVPGDGALDPWTVLAHVASGTTGLGLATRGLGLADRVPAVLARSAANLDQLAAGRLSLGLSPDPAHGDEAVDVLAEAVEVLRGMWDAADPRPLVVDGRHVRVPGAQRGPAPAHNLPLWLGADPGDPAGALALAARVADGWWLSGAADAPAHVPAQQRALDAALARFAGEVVPAVRERVAAARAARGTVVGTVRSAAVRAARRPGIDYDAIPAALASTAVEPGDAGYAAVRSTYLRGGRPGLVLRPASTAEVVEALAFARSQDVPLAIRSGGHGISGRSTNDGGIVLDLSRMRAIEVLDHATRRVRIEPGARWGDVAEALQPLGWALTSGDSGGVGVGGLATAGGIGFLVREHGLTLDHLRAAEVVLADGSVVRVSDTEHPDLFWGVRGAGANLGVVTSFEFEVDEVGDVGFAHLVFDASDTEQFLVDWGAAVEAAPRDTTAFLIMGPPRGGLVAAQVMAMVDSDDPDTIIARLQPFARIAPLLQQQVQVLPYSAVVTAPEVQHTSEGEPVTRTAMAEHLTPALAADAARLVRSGATSFFQIRAAGGAVHDVPADATAYAHRSANFSVLAFGGSRRRLDALWDAMAEHFDGLYVSFETDPRPERLADAWPGATLARLRDLKRRYDPHDVFRHNFSVAEPPAVVV